MKKIFISLAVIACAAFTAKAQTLLVVEERPVLTNKHGVRILPQAGDVGIGVNANPFLKYLGNMFNREYTNVAPTFTGQNSLIYAKFFVADNQAIRAGVALNFYNQYYHGSVRSNTDENRLVSDTKKDIHQGFGLTLGYEWRTGHGRVQGFYGLQAGFGYDKVKTNYTWGNAMNGEFPYPWSWDFTTNTAEQATQRTLENRGATNFTLGVSSFVGVEYFVAPKISVGGEFNLGLAWTSEGKTKVRSQYYDLPRNTLVEETVEMRDPAIPSDGLSLRTLTDGNIFVTFYF